MSVERPGTRGLGGVVREADVSHVEERLRVGRVAALEHDVVGALDRGHGVAAALEAERLALSAQELGPEREGRIASPPVLPLIARNETATPVGATSPSGVGQRTMS